MRITKGSEHLENAPSRQIGYRGHRLQQILSGTPKHSAPLSNCSHNNQPTAGAKLGTAELTTPLTWQVWHGLSVVFPGIAVGGAHRPEVKGAVGHDEAQAIGFVDVGGAQRAILRSQKNKMVQVKQMSLPTFSESKKGSGRLPIFRPYQTLALEDRCAEMHENGDGAVTNRNLWS